MARPESSNWFCFVLQCVLETTWFLVKNWGLRSILEGSPINCFCPALSGGGSEVVWEFYLIIPTQDGLLVPSNILWGLRYCCWVSDIRQLVWRRSLGTLLLPYLPVTPGAPNVLERLIWSCMRCPVFLGGSPKLPEGLLRDYEWHTGKSAPFLIFPPLTTNKGIDGMLPFSLTGILVNPSFLPFCEEEKIKYR